MEPSEITPERIELARGGDREAFERLAADCRPRLVSFIQRRLGSQLRGETEVEDILQEALTEAFTALHRFEWRGEKSFFNWLATIAEFKIRGLARSKRPPAGLESRDDVAVPDASPSRGLRREARFERLEAALRMLEDDHRHVIRLARIEGLSTAEVAERMGRSPGAVRHLLLRALEKLRERFGDETASLSLPARELDFLSDAKGDSHHGDQ